MLCYLWMFSSLFFVHILLNYKGQNQSSICKPIEVTLFLPRWMGSIILNLATFYWCWFIILAWTILFRVRFLNSNIIQFEPIHLLLIYIYHIILLVYKTRMTTSITSEALWNYKKDIWKRKVNSLNDVNLFYEIGVLS